MAGLTNYFRNKLFDHNFRGQPWTPPAVLYIELVQTAPSAGVAGTACAGTGYARQAIPSDLLSWSGTQGDGTTGVSSGTSGVISNNVEVDYGFAGAAWGTASHWEAWDAVTGGNRLHYGLIVDGLGAPASRPIAAGDPVKFPVGALRLNWI